MSHNITVEGGKTVRLLTAGKYCDRDIVVTAMGGGAAEPAITPLEVRENGVYNPPTGLDGYAPVSVNVPIPDGYIVPSGTLNINKNGTHNVRTHENVSVNVPIPDGYIVPSGELEISQNGTHDVAQYASVVVNVQGGSTEPDPRDDYQRVEYIESAEEETYPYIITDFYGDNESGLEVIGEFDKMQDRITMGSRENSDATRFYCAYPLSTSSVYYGFNTGASVSCATKINTKYRLQTNFLNSRMINVFDMDGIRKASTALNATLVDQSVPVSIFGYHSATSGVVTSKREFKLYSARCSKGHEVVREYIPCYRKSDGVVGLYEKFTGQFLTNADADGSAFAAGAEIDW